MNRELVSFVGIGIGEEAKGAATEWATGETQAHTVWRSGGSQAGHNIVRSDGREHTFSHFSTGTFDGARTYLKHMVINPVDLFTEGIALEEKGIDNPFKRIVISSDCLTTTPYHSAMSRFREIMRGPDKKGTIGTGVGEAVIDAQEHPDLAIRAGEFTGDREALLKKLEATRRYKIDQVTRFISQEGFSELPPEAIAELRVLGNETLKEKIADSFQGIGQIVRIVDDSYLDEMLETEGTIVHEPSHGALLHPRDGFVPHVTQIDPLGKDVFRSLGERFYRGNVLRIGVSRCYMTRHGAGPLVSYDQTMTRNIQDVRNNANQNANEWLGEVRNGPYDIVATKYAIDIAGGPEMFTGLKISHLDELAKQQQWEVCEGYNYTGTEEDLSDFFETNNTGDIIRIKRHPDDGSDRHYDHQRKLTKLLKECKPILNTLKPTEEKSLEDVFIDYVEEQLDVPVVAVARGPRKEDRELRPGWEELFMNGKHTRKEVRLG